MTSVPPVHSISINSSFNLEGELPLTRDWAGVSLGGHREHGRLGEVVLLLLTASIAVGAARTLLLRLWAGEDSGAVTAHGSLL